MPIFDQLSRAAEERGLKFLVIGGHAVIAHGYARTTFDLDLLVERTRSAAWEELLASLDYRVHARHEAFVQFNTPSPHAWPVDLMLASAETFAGMWGEAGEAQVESVTVRIPSLRHLLALKLHVLKQDLGHRAVKDMNDVIQLIEANGLDIRTDEFRQLCLRYGNGSLYENLLNACR
jgi:hypothetical protein